MKFTKEVQIALVAIIGIVILFFGMQFLKGQKVFSKTDNYYVHFDDISGVGISTPIFANGFKIGKVDRIDYNYNDPNDIVAVISVNEEMRIPKDTRAEIVSDVLGNVKVVLQLSDKAAGFLAAGDSLYGGQQNGLVSRAANLMPTIEQMMPKLDSILATVNALLNSPALTNSLNNLETLTANLTTTTNELRRLSVSLNQQVPALMGKADGVLDNAGTLTKNLSELDVAATLERVNNTLNNLEQTTARLNSNEGTLGLLMRDASLYNNLDATIRHADSLMIDLKRHPKRYVHFSVFGKKDN